MSKSSVRIDETQFTRIQKILAKFRGDILTPFLRDVGVRLVNDFKLGFRNSKAPDDSRWEPVQREGKPLIDTGRLRSSIHAVVTPGRLEVGTNVVYGPTHQYGDDSTIRVTVPEHTRLINQAFGRPLRFGVYSQVKEHSKNIQRNIPARPFLGIEQRQKRKIIRTFATHVERITNGEATS